VCVVRSRGGSSGALIMGLVLLLVGAWMHDRTPVKPHSSAGIIAAPSAVTSSPGGQIEGTPDELVTGGGVGRGPVPVARGGEGRSHDCCPRRAWNRWHHRLDRSCACGPVFRQALNQGSRFGPERPGSPR